MLPNSSFSHEIPKLQLAWDSVSSGALKKCPRYYELSIIEGYRPMQFGDDQPNVDLYFGILIHSASEVYEDQRAAGFDHETAIRHTVYCLLINTWDFIRKRPWVSGDSTKNRYTLIRTAILYFDKYKDDPIKTRILSNGKPAIEHSFRVDLSDIDGRFVSSSGESYLLCGHLDKVGDWEDQVVIPDKKTTKWDLNDDYFTAYAPDNQVSIYSLAGRIILLSEVEGVIIDGIQILVGGNRFRRKLIPRSEEQLSEWLTDFAYKLRENETYVRDNYWPMNDRACGFGRLQCTYRKVCSADVHERQELLDNFFIRRLWDPMVPR